MHIPAHLVAGWAIAACWLAVLGALLAAVYFAQWRLLLTEPRRMHLVAGGSVFCLLLWLLNVNVVETLVIHFLGLTTLTLLIGWSFTVIGASLAMLAFYGVMGMPLSGIAVSLCLTVLVPATVSRLFSWWLYRPSLRHPFVYILGAGFGGGALVTLVLGVLAFLLFWSRGLDVAASSFLEWWPLLFLLMFSEGFINGMCVSALAVFYPDWLKTFDDRFYLDDD